MGYAMPIPRNRTGLPALARSPGGEPVLPTVYMEPSGGVVPLPLRPYVEQNPVVPLRPVHDRIEEEPRAPCCGARVSRCECVPLRAPRRLTPEELGAADLEPTLPILPDGGIPGRRRTGREKWCCGTSRASCECVPVGPPRAYVEPEAERVLPPRRYVVPSEEQVVPPRPVHEAPVWSWKVDGLRYERPRRPVLPIWPGRSGEEDEAREAPAAILSISLDPWLLSGLAAQIGSSDVVLNTRHVQASTFRFSDPLRFTLQLVGLPAFSLVQLTLRVLRTASMPEEQVGPDVTFSGHADATGTWTQTWVDPPQGVLGHYRVLLVEEESFPTMVLPAQGTRPANHFTYAVVPDPEWRDAGAPPVGRTFFGLHSTYPGFALLPWLGVRWVNHPSYPWAIHTDPSSRPNWSPGSPPWSGEWPATGPWAGLPQPQEAGDGPEYAPDQVAPYYWWMDPDAADSGSPDWYLPGPWDVEEDIGELGDWGIYPLPTLYEMGIPGAGDTWWTLNDAWEVAGPGEEDSYGDVGDTNRIARLEAGDGVRAWAGYCFRAARKLAAEYGRMEHRLYRVTAEPIPWRKYRGQLVGVPPDEDSGWFWFLNSIYQASAIEGLAEVYEIAARQIHAGDPGGRVIGPTMENLLVGGFAASHWDGFSLGYRPGWYAPLANLEQRDSPYFNTEGLLYRTGPSSSTPPIVESLDGFALHPYVWGGGNLPAMEDLAAPNQLLPADVDGRIIEELTKIKAGLPPDMPLYATEFGFNTNETTGNRDTGRDQSGRDLDQARLLIRQNLILLGEGFSQGISFNTRDHDKGEAVRQYGLYYNLEDHPLHPGARLASHPSWLAPRPAAAAYAAMTWLLEGHVALQSWTEALTQALGVLAYAYTDGEDVVLALWDPTNFGHLLFLGPTLPSRFGWRDVAWTGPVYDWMGNVLFEDVAGARVTPGPEPVYVRGVLPVPGDLRPAGAPSRGWSW